MEILGSLGALLHSSVTLTVNGPNRRRSPSRFSGNMTWTRTPPCWAISNERRSPLWPSPVGLLGKQLKNRSPPSGLGRYSLFAVQPPPSALSCPRRRLGLHPSTFCSLLLNELGSRGKGRSPRSGYKSIALFSQYRVFSSSLFQRMLGQLFEATVAVMTHWSYLPL